MQYSVLERELSLIRRSQEKKYSFKTRAIISCSLTSHQGSDKDIELCTPRKTKERRGFWSWPCNYHRSSLCVSLCRLLPSFLSLFRTKSITTTTTTNDFNFPFSPLKWISHSLSTTPPLSVRQTQKCKSYNLPSFRPSFVPCSYYTQRAERRRRRR